MSSLPTFFSTTPKAATNASRSLHISSATRLPTAMNQFTLAAVSTNPSSMPHPSSSQFIPFGTAAHRLHSRLSAALRAASTNPQYTDKRGYNEAARLLLLLKLKRKVSKAYDGHLEPEIEPSEEVTEQVVSDQADEGPHMQSSVSGETSAIPVAFEDQTMTVERQLTPEEEMLTLFRCPTEVAPEQWF